MRILHGHTGPVLCLAYSPDGATLASGSWDQTVRLWDTATGAERGRLPDLKGLVRALAFSPDGRMLAVACSGVLVYIRDSRRWKSQPVSTVQDVLSLAFSPDGRYLALAVPGPAGVHWHDLSNQHARISVQPADQDITALAFDPAGRCLAAAGVATHGLLTLPLPTARAVWETHGSHEGPLLSLAVDPGARRIATGGRDGFVRLWEQEGKGYTSDALGQHDGWVLGTGFTPDGRGLLSASLDGVVKVWDVTTGRQSAALDWQIGTVRAVAFAPDGLTAAAGGFDNSILVWDVE